MRSAPGSILGPTLFLCYINDMSMALGCRLALYADDSALLASGPNSERVAEFLSVQLARCKTWLVDNRLSLHVGKTECILFGTHKRLKGANFIVKCGDAIVNRVDCVKYLGVFLDPTLCFRDHALDILKKGKWKATFFVSLRCGPG